MPPMIIGSGPALCGAVIDQPRSNTMEVDRRDALIPRSPRSGSAPLRLCWESYVLARVTRPTIDPWDDVGAPSRRSAVASRCRQGPTKTILGERLLASPLGVAARTTGRRGGFFCSGDDPKTATIRRGVPETFTALYS